MLLPLHEAPLHVPLRLPRPLRFERLRVGGEGKADANLTNFLSSFFLMIRRPPTSPLFPSTTLFRSKTATRPAQKTAPFAPRESTQEVRNPKIGQQLGAQPTPRFRG